MIGRDHLDPAEIKHPPSERRNLLIRLEQGLSGKCSQSTNDPGSDGIDLSEDKGMAGLDLVRFRIPILRGPALDDVGDVNVFSPKADGLDDLRQKLPGPSDKGPSLSVLIVPRTLSNKHQASFRISFTENERTACLVELASPAIS